MAGLLLDSHALFWLVTIPDQLTDEALVAIEESQRAEVLYVSPITAWELSVAAQKPAGRDRPHFEGRPVDAWFRYASRLVGARTVPIGTRIALESAAVAGVFGRKDPGDCFLIATARVRRRVPLLTRDGLIRNLARDRPDYLQVVAC